MEGHGWKKELTIKHIEITRGQIICEEWDYFADRMPCRMKEGGISGPQCGIDHSWVCCIGGKLFWACFRHRIANGPISRDIGNKAKEYPVTASDAMDICRQTGQMVLPELMDAYQKEMAGKISKRRRPNQ